MIQQVSMEIMEFVETQILQNIQSSVKATDSDTSTG